MKSLGRGKLRSKTREKNILEYKSPDDLGDWRDSLSEGKEDDGKFLLLKEAYCVPYHDNNAYQRASLTSLTLLGVPGPLNRRKKQILPRKQS